MQFDTSPMNALERRATAGLAGIFALRLLGLFLILPVFALYAEDLQGRTPFLIGLALGIYGLTQAVLQIPFGMASDHFGRKPVIIMGLLVFAAGSVVAALSTTIEGVIIGRALQGAGAVAAAAIAMLADLTREDQRTKAMAIVGITIGASFILSLLLGPVFSDAIGVPGIFWLTAILAVGGILVLLLAVPTPVHRVNRQAPAGELRRVLRDRRLMRFNLGIFVLHSVLMAVFVVVPLVLVEQAGIAAGSHWRVYLPVMLLAVVLMIPLLYLAERKRQLRRVFAGAVLLLVLSQAAINGGQGSILGIGAGLVLFFTAFNVLEALLPSLISRTAPPESKGAAIGVYSSFEFLGVFAGGAGGGWLHGAYGVSAVFLAGGALLLLWFFVALTMHDPQALTTRLVRVGPQASQEAQRLAEILGAIRGVAEAVVVKDEGVAYLKVDVNTLDERALDEYSLSA